VHLQHHQLTAPAGVVGVLHAVQRHHRMRRAGVKALSSSGIFSATWWNLAKLKP